MAGDIEVAATDDAVDVVVLGVSSSDIARHAKLLGPEPAKSLPSSLAMVTSSRIWKFVGR